MAENYRPSLNRKTAKILFDVLKIGLEHIELSKDDLRLVLLFMNKISEWETMAAFLERLDKQIPDFDESEHEQQVKSQIRELTSDESTNMFSDWDDEALQHFIIAHPEDEKAQWAQQEFNRRTRAKESSVVSIRPPSTES